MNVARSCHGVKGDRLSIHNTRIHNVGGRRVARDEKQLFAEEMIVCFPAKVNMWLTEHLCTQAKLLQWVAVMWYFSYFKELYQAE